MAYTALELITRSYYLSQVVARDVQTVSGSQVADGLYLLNALLDFKGSDIRNIPYFRRASFSTVAGTDNYFVDNLVFVDTMTFLLDGNVRFPMIDTSRKEFFGTPRVNNIQSMMYQYRLERELGGMRVYLYFVPNQVYTIQYSGKFDFDQVALTTDLSLTYDLFYIEYMRYLLAEMICSEYGATFPEESQKKLAEYTKKIMDTSPPDLTSAKMTYFNNNGFNYDWPTINLYKGYLPNY